MRAFYLSPRLFWILAGLVLAFVLGYFWPLFTPLARLALFGTLGLVILDTLLLYARRVPLEAARRLPDRFSNGDPNPVRVTVRNTFSFPIRATVLDELPIQFQIRDARHLLRLAAGQSKTFAYTLRPVERGAYQFGALNLFVQTPLGLVERRFRFDEEQTIPVYPSFLQMRQYELLAISNRLQEVGVKKIRRVGHTMEFDHIREYVVGDDYRTVNWKATARRGSVMVNQFQDERAQPIYCLLDMGRVMEMPFEQLSLLDYSINAALVLSNIALLKQDRAGLVAFSHEIHTTVPARRKSGQIYRLQDALYNLQTDFLESDYQTLLVHLRRTLRQRSLLLLFTNFMTPASMRRQLPYLRTLARQHLVVAIFFENTELRSLLDTTPQDTEGIYVKTIAEKFAFEKREIVRELGRHGIQSILTPPQQLSVNTINKYLALKAQGLV